MRNGCGAVWGGGKFDSQFGNTALIFASDKGQPDCARLLIDAGADQNAKAKVFVVCCFD